MSVKYIQKYASRQLNIGKVVYYQISHHPTESTSVCCWLNS